MRFLLILPLFLASCYAKTYQQASLVEALQSSMKIAMVPNDDDPRVQETIELFKLTYADYDVETLKANLSKLYHEQAFFNDRVHTQHGAKDIEPYLIKGASKAHKAEFLFHNVMVTPKGIYVHWTMRVTFKEGDTPIDFLGMSHLMLADNYQIIYHQDYWDFSELISEIPIIGRIINLIKSRA